MNMTANRLSYYFGFHGPSLATDTACSSSATALYLAVQSLLSDECTMAVCGAVNAVIYPYETMIMCKGGVLSPTGRCKPLDENADGYVRSDGATIFVLKKLKKAIEDGDNIHTVIRSVSGAHDGKASNIGFLKISQKYFKK